MKRIIKNPFVVIISGPAASGKTTLAKYLSEELGLPLIYKDLFKEALYETLGKPDLEMHRKMGAYSHTMLEKVSEELSSKGVSHIIEGPFSDKLFTPFLQRIGAKYGASFIQIQFKCDGQTLLQRFVEREQKGEAHWGHQGLVYLDVMRESLLRGELDHLSVDSAKLVVDSTDFSCLSHSDILAFVCDRMLKKPAAIVRN